MSRHMFPPRKVLLPTDMSEASAVALAFAKILHQQFQTANTLLHAQYFEMPLYFSSGQMDLMKRELERSRRLASDNLGKEGRAAIGAPVDVVIVEKPAVEAILETAHDLDIDLIVMGTHGRRGAGRLLLGSVAERVLRESDRPVIAVRQNWNPTPVRNVLCPLKDSEAGRSALEYAAQVARASGARLSVLHVAEEGASAMECPLVGDEIRQICTLEESVIHGDAANTILEAAQVQKPDLIVMGADRKPSFLGELFSSTTQKVMQASPAPILVVPRI